MSYDNGRPAQMGPQFRGLLMVPAPAGAPPEGKEQGKKRRSPPLHFSPYRRNFSLSWYF